MRGAAPEALGAGETQHSADRSRKVGCEGPCLQPPGRRAAVPPRSPTELQRRPPAVVWGLGRPGSRPHVAQAMGSRPAQADSSGEMREARGLLKRWNGFPTRSAAPALEDSQALSRERCCFPGGAVRTRLTLGGPRALSGAGRRGPEHPSASCREGARGGLAGSALALSRGRPGQACPPEAARAGGSVSAASVARAQIAGV